MKSKLTVLGLLIVSVAFLSACQGKRNPSSSGDLSSASGLKTIYFDFDSSSIRSDMVSIVEKNGAYLKKSSRSVTIEGNCDERGTNEYNMALGDRRAQAVKNYLVNLSVDPMKLNTVSFGEEKPAASCSDESCWWQNRRAQFMQ